MPFVNERVIDGDILGIAKYRHEVTLTDQELTDYHKYEEEVIATCFTPKMLSLMCSIREEIRTVRDPRSSRKLVFAETTGMMRWLGKIMKTGDLATEYVHRRRRRDAKLERPDISSATNSPGLLGFFLKD